MNNVKTKTTKIEVNRLVDFNQTPFRVRNDEEMRQLVSSIDHSGVLVPLIVNHVNDNYVILSGHRRKLACIQLGIREVPAVIYDRLNINEATMIVVDTNLMARQELLISEKAKGYAMQLKALQELAKNRKNIAESYNSRLILAERMLISSRQLQQYIRLTGLMEELLVMVDAHELAINPAVELSFLSRPQQEDVVEAITEIKADSTRDIEPNITHAQARILRRMAEEDKLNIDSVIEVLSTPKPNQKDKLHISLEDIGPYMPRGYTDAQCRQYLVELARREYERRQKSEKVKKELGL